MKQVSEVNVVYANLPCYLES